MRLTEIAFLAAAALILPVGAASAHAHLQQSDPAVGATVHHAPAGVAITFSEGVEPDFSTIVVQNAAGARVDKNDVHLAPGSDKRLTVDLKPLPAGTYKVIWHATSVDTHKTQGSFAFTVAR